MKKMETWQKEAISKNLSQLVYSTRLHAYFLNTVIVTGLLDTEELLSLVRYKCFLPTYISWIS